MSDYLFFLEDTGFALGMMKYDFSCSILEKTFHGRKRKTTFRKKRKKKRI